MDMISIIREGGIFYLLLLIAVTMHEFGHAFLADKMGDPLPRLQGRVTINPLAHIDIVGTVVLPLATIFLMVGSGFPILFGWGKPVELSLADPKTRTKVDLVSTAGGVGMNLVVALVSAVLLGIFSGLKMGESAEIAGISIFINCMLFVINMIPIPPLDGAHFLKHLSNMSDQMYYSISRWGIVIFLVLINIPIFSRLVSFCVTFLSQLFFMVGALVGRIF